MSPFVQHNAACPGKKRGAFNHAMFHAFDHLNTFHQENGERETKRGKVGVEEGNPLAIRNQSGFQIWRRVQNRRKCIRGMLCRYNSPNEIA